MTGREHRSRHARSRVPKVLNLAVLLAASSAASEPLPIEYFTREDDIGLVKISPDGEYLAATTKLAGISGLIFFELGSTGLKGGLRARQGDEITGFDWISDTRVIYSYGERYGAQEYVSGTGEIFAVDRDGTRSTILYGYRAGDKHTGSRLGTRDSTYARGELLDVLENDDDEILILERPYELRGNTYYLDSDAYARVALLDVYSGDSDPRGFVPLKLANVIVDAHEEVRFAVGYDDKANFSVIWKPEVDAEWTQFELPGFREATVIPRRFTADGSGVYFTGAEVGESLDALYRLDLATRNVERCTSTPMPRSDPS